MPFFIIPRTEDTIMYLRGPRPDLEQVEKDSTPEPCVTQIDEVE